MLPPTPPCTPIEPGATWYGRGTGGHPPGDPVRVLKLTPWSVVVRHLASHARRSGRCGERKKTLPRAMFLALYRPQRP